MPFFLERLGEDNLRQTDRVNIRLYGGWYEEKFLTQLAQRIQSEISTNFPAPVQIKSAKVVVTVDLARSLITSPKHDLLHTYRTRNFPRNIRCSEPPYDGCKNRETCPVDTISDFVNRNKCIIKECNVRPKQIFLRPTQKLVDSMIVADIISLASRNYACAVVSSDDDIWPGIRAAVEFGSPVYHLQSKPNRTTPTYYTEGVPENYLQVTYTA